MLQSMISAIDTFETARVEENPQTHLRSYVSSVSLSNVRKLEILNGSDQAFFNLAFNVISKALTYNIVSTISQSVYYLWFFESMWRHEMC